VLFFPIVNCGESARHNGQVAPLLCLHYSEAIVSLPLGRRHASEIASLSVDLREGLKTFKIPHLPEEQLKLRIGLHTGKLEDDNQL
jgi:hypothetical protein